MRRVERLIGIQFVLPDSLERDLLISKLFTKGGNTAGVQVSSGAAVLAMLGSIITLKSRDTKPAVSHAGGMMPDVPLPAVTLVLPPRPRVVDLGALAHQREQMVA